MTGLPSKEKEPPRVNPLRSRTFIELLGERMGIGEVRAVLGRLPPEIQAHLPAAEANGWIDQSSECSILTELSRAFDAWSLLETLGSECVSGHLSQMLPVLPGLRRLSDVLNYVPSLVAVFQTALSARLHTEAVDAGMACWLELAGALEPPEIVFYRGFLLGLLAFLEAEEGRVDMIACPLARADFPQGLAAGEDVVWAAPELVFRISARAFKQSLANQQREAARLGWNTSAREAFVKQVMARSSRLLRDKRELTTAVEYLNIANDELDRQLRENEKELSMAGNIQRSFVPPLIPDWEGLQFWVHYSPLTQVSGDLYDYFPLAENRRALLVADVSGHGVPAALISSIAKISFQSHQQAASPADIFSNVNMDLLNYVKMEGYLAATYFIIDSEHQVTYSVAAMPGPYLFRARTGEVSRLPGRGTMLGMFANATEYFTNQTVRLEPGDRLFVFTDGLTEAINARGEHFGEDNLVRAIRRTAGMSVRESCEQVIDAYRNYILGAGAHDDLTLLVMMVNEHRDRFEELLGEAEAYFQDGFPASASACMQKAVAIFPRHPEALYRYSKYLARSGRYQEALEYLGELKKLEPHLPNAYTIEGYCNYKLGRLERAAADLKQSLAIRGENPSALFHMVKVLWKQGKQEEARRVLLDLKYLLPEHPRVSSLKLQKLSGE